MTVLVSYAALACVVAGLVAAALTLVTTKTTGTTETTGRGLPALRTALDFWLAAGLLRLGQADGWEPILSAATIVVIRRLAAAALDRRLALVRRPALGRGGRFSATHGADPDALAAPPIR